MEAAVRVGCSECVCVAIEAHRPALLKSLLRRSDLHFRDVFWSPTPRLWTPHESLHSSAEIPVLHDVPADCDLSFVGRDDCGHMRLDVDLCTAFDALCRQNAYILVSLPLMARWHSSKRFDAERILRQSGKFDYSAPQFFHVNYENQVLREDSLTLFRGPLNLFRSVTLCCEFEGRAETTSALPVDALQLLQHSSAPARGLVRVYCEFHEHSALVAKLYGEMSRLFHEAVGLDALEFQEFRLRRDLQRALRSGADLHQLMFGQKVTWFHRGSHRQIHQYDPLAQLIALCVHLYVENWTLVQTRSICRYFKCLLHNGLAFFHAELADCVRTNEDEVGANYSPLAILLSTESRVFLPVAHGIAKQLLALGYGRRELHSGRLPVRDENLVFTRQAALEARQRPGQRGGNGRSRLADELKRLVEQFDAGPLTLQQLARIALRRAVSGVCFAQRMRAIAHLMPKLLFEYVAEANEMLPL